MDKIQKIGVSAFIYKQGQVLIVKRSKKETFMPGFYDLPGGKVNFGETLEKAIVREVREEMGLKVKCMNPYSSFTYISSKGKWHNLDVQFLVKIIGSNKIRLTSAHDDFRWINSREIGKYKMSKERKESIKKGFAELKNN